MRNYGCVLNGECSIVIHRSYPQAHQTCGKRPRFTLLLDLWDTMHSARQGPIGIARRCVVHLLAGLCLLLSSPGASAVDLETIQSYAGHKLTPLEFSAALTLWNHESNWNIRASNGSHWGLCQGRSQYMKHANYRQQVRWCISYAYNRYGSMALALKHWRRYGWH